ncbi:MAG TPA: biotin/lipoyl-binding protein, partial [Xanthobacteraceae bacterium]|nr:biotin/lipoyl-binding protein [Xanthobacteraceae bacterium]
MPDSRHRCIFGFPSCEVRCGVALGHSLFRQEAIEFQRGQREFGEIALLQPVSTKLLGWLLIGVVTIAIVFLCFAQFSRKQTVSGFLVPAAGTLKVFPTREGVVAALYVKEGQLVKAGEPLFAVATPEIAADGEDVNAAKLAALKRQKETLAHQIAEERTNAAAERDRLAVLAASTQAQIADLRSQIAIQNQRVQLSETLVSAAQELLAKGYMSVVEGKRREDAVLEHKQNLALLQRQLSEQQGKRAEAQYQLKELPTATA